MKKQIFFFLFFISVPLALAMYSGETAQVLHLDKCRDMNVTVKGDLPIVNGEYRLLNCTQTSMNKWHCPCSNNYNLRIQTLANALNKYKITAKYTYPGMIDYDDDGFNSQCDCNDHDRHIYPDAPERCNNVDDNCDGKVDEPVCDTATDRDCDGVSDCKKDQCLGTPRNARVDGSGCSAEQYCNGYFYEKRNPRFIESYKCITADWKSNERYRLFPQDCEVDRERQGRNYIYSCVPTRTVN